MVSELFLLYCLAIIIMKFNKLTNKYNYQIDIIDLENNKPIEMKTNSIDKNNIIIINIKYNNNSYEIKITKEKK